MTNTLEPPKIYAFIDVQNTETTARQILGFKIDWIKLCEYLKQAWKCQEIFLYVGVDEGDTDRESIFTSLSSAGYSVRLKYTSAYRNKDKIIQLICPECKARFSERVYSGYNRKANCDVDLAVDAMQYSAANTEFLIFTGDGDFGFLIERIVDTGTRVYIVSSNAPVPNSFPETKRLSKKLRKLIGEHRGKINMIDLKSWQARISQ